VSRNMLWSRLASGSNCRPSCSKVLLRRIGHELPDMSRASVSHFHSSSCLRSSDADGNIPVVKVNEISPGLRRVIMSDMKTR